MRFSLLAIIAACAASAAAVPVAELFERTIAPPPTPGCEPRTAYNVTATSPAPILGNNPSVVAMTCDGTGGDCTLGSSYSYSVSMSISVGLNLGLSPKDIATSAGLTIGYSYSTTKGTSDSASLHCPDGPWICGIQVTPWVKQVSGFQYTVLAGPCGNKDGTPKFENVNPYTVQFPQITDNLPNVDAKLCACPNAQGATASGAPPVCPSSC